MEIIKSGFNMPDDNFLCVGNYSCSNCGCIFRLGVEDQHLICSTNTDSITSVFGIYCPTCQNWVRLAEVVYLENDEIDYTNFNKVT
jgi:hypothetical protein